MPPFKNRYHALRHGVSLANEKGLIVSHPENGVSGYGLSERGVTECRHKLAPAAHGLRFSAGDTVCYSSDFARARETAEIFVELNGLGSPILKTELRERNFGELELGPDNQYPAVWKFDAENETHTEHGAESVASVLLRLRRLLEECESEHAGKNLVFTAHGDVLQILQTIFAEIPGGRHRELPHLGNAELRVLNNPT